jgi:hypothetical protein
MAENTDILNGIIDSFKTAIAQSMQDNGRYSTGQTIAELQEVVTDNYGALLAPYWIDALENGRKPTPPGTPAGDPTLREALIPWLEAKGIPDSAAYAIANKIHKYGYPGKPGVLTVPLSNDSVDNLMAPGLEQLASSKAQQIADLWNVFDEI